jgi:hypothetical protein
MSHLQACAHTSAKFFLQPRFLQSDRCSAGVGVLGSNTILLRRRNTHLLSHNAASYCIYSFSLFIIQISRQQSIYATDTTCYYRVLLVRLSV